MDVVAVFQRLPPVTKCFMGGAVALGLVRLFGLVNNPYLFAFVPHRILHGEIHRIATSLFYIGDFGLSWLTSVPFLMEIMSYFEEIYFGSSRSLLLLMLWIVLISIAMLPWIRLSYLSTPIRMVLTCLWSRLEQGRNGRIFLLGISATALPYLFWCWALFLGEDGLPELFGLVLGNLTYYCLTMIPIMFPGNKWIKQRDI